MSPGAGALSMRGRVAFVTGAAGGIGAATVATLAAAGAAVTAVDLARPALEDLARRHPAAVLPVVADVTDPAAVERAVGAARARWGRLDVLINNAGVVRDARLENVTEEDWNSTLDVNLRAAMLCARAVVPHMRAAGFGRLLSATSVVARSGNFGQTAYCAAKAGIIGLTRAWARELGPQGITANAVAPGFIDTPMLASVPAKVLDGARARVPAGRLGRPEEVANVYLFLASDLASFMNGAVVGVDGGLLL
jgi:3-oxoacyl-[acyl-carrier protein] reductase